MRLGVKIGVSLGPRMGAVAASPAAPVSTDKASYTTAETIQVSFTGSTAIRDWLNIVPVGSGAGVTGTWIYCGTGNQGAASILASGTWPMGPLSAGTYEVRFLADDGFTAIGTSTPFTVA